MNNIFSFVFENENKKEVAQKVLNGKLGELFEKIKKQKSDKEEDSDETKKLEEDNLELFNNTILEKELTDEERRQNVEKSLIAFKFLAYNEETIKDSKYVQQMKDEYEFTKKLLLNDDGSIKSEKESRQYYKEHKKELGGYFKRQCWKTCAAWCGDESVRKVWQEQKPDLYGKAEKDVKSEIKFKETPKEIIVKDADGSQIHQRAKKVGDGYTYVRTKGGKETGYASKEDFQKAQQRKAKKQNESLDCMSLIDFLCS